MSSASPSEGGPQFISARVRKTIQSIKEIVRNHSDAEIYVALKDSNMDPNETTQKLLNQDPFHEVKRKRDKKKELQVTVHKDSSNLEPRRPTGNAVRPGMKVGRRESDHKDSSNIEPRRPTGNIVRPGMRVGRIESGHKDSSNLEPRRPTGNIVRPGMRVGRIESDHNFRRGGGYVRNTIPAVAVLSRQFRVVRDNRANQNSIKQVENPNISKVEPVASNVTENRGFHRNSNQKQAASISAKPSSSGGRKDISEEDRRAPKYESSEMMKQNGGSPTSMNSNNSNINGAVLGLYSSSSDPVHVPSLDPRPSANKRQVGVVGVRRPHFSKNNTTSSPSQNDQPSQTAAAATIISERSSLAAAAPAPALAPAIPSIPTVRSLINNHHHHSSSNRSQQQSLAHHKVSQPNKEWKPKSSQKTNVNGPGVIGSPAKSGDDDNSNKKEKSVVEELKEKVSNQNVIIAPHIRVSDIDRSRLTFGTLDTHLLRASHVDDVQPSVSVSVSSPESSSEDSKNVEAIDDGGLESDCNSPASEIKVSDSTVLSSSSPQEMSSFAEIGLVHDDNASYTPSESQQLHHHEESAELPTFSAYDPHSGYDMRYFRPIMDESVMRGQGLLSPQEDLSSHMVNSMPASTMAMVQQQQQQQAAAAAAAAQMYPQVHFTNIMPYRQYMSPVYMPQGMTMSGYSPNPAVGGAVAYPPINGGPGYVLMPNLSGGVGGGTSPHLTAPPKYGIQQQFKTLNAPTGAGEDPSRIMKYKDSSLYIPNPQAETSEIWMNPRDIPGLQPAAAYYNMTGQMAAHGAATYMPPHIAHHQHHAGSYGGAAVGQQSSHIQFPGGLYHSQPPQQQTANPHHMGGGGPATPLAYQQQQLGHLPWTGTF